MNVGEVERNQIDLEGTPVVRGCLTLPPIVSGPCAPQDKVPPILADSQADLTLSEGIVGVKLAKPKTEPRVKQEPKRTFLEHVYERCNESRPGNRKFDDYGLPVPKMETAHDGIVYSFEPEDVWRCYAPCFLDEWEEYESKFEPGKKVKQVAPKAEFWDRPPGALGRAIRLDTHWNARQMGVGREYVMSEKCWCMYPRSDTEICSALWACLTLDPGHAESSPEQDAPMNADDLGGTCSTSVEHSVVGGVGIRAENTGWVNVMVFNLQRLQRKLDNSFVILWAGFSQEYYDQAAVRKEWNARFRVPFAMQLVSNEFLESQAAVAYTGSDGKLRMGFSTERKPVDRTTPRVKTQTLLREKDFYRTGE